MNKLIKYFPFPTIRNQQKEALEFAIDIFENQKKKFVIIEAGTGVGKSAIGVALNRYFLDKNSAGEFLPGAYFLTTQKILQQQYLNDFGRLNGNMLSLKSSSNFTCTYNKKNSCADSLRALSCAERSSKFFRTCAFNCVYKQTKKDFINGSAGITNFAYFLAETQYAGHLKPRDMLVIDEAHNVELQLSKFIEVTISERFAKSVLKLKWPQKITQAAAVKWVKEIYLPKLDKHCKHAKKIIEKYLGMKDKLKEFAALAKKLEMLDKHLCKINRFLEMYNSSNWVVNEQKAFGRSLRKLEFKPIDVSSFGYEMLFEKANKVILMSATILNKEAFCQSLGIDPDEAGFISFPSPFPRENRPILFTPVGSMAAKNIDQTLPIMVNAIKEILKAHPDDKGIIHCHSYKIANFIKNNIRNKRLLIHNSDNREETLNRHINDLRPTVLLSPSMTEGIDLKDECSRFQILCKVPFPYLGDKLVKKRMYKWRWWYPLQTAKTIVQSTGRSIRHKDDFAVTYILDDDWNRFSRNNRKFLPEDFLKCIQ